MEQSRAGVKTPRRGKMTRYPIGDFQEEVLRALLVKNGQSFIRELDEYLTSKLERNLLTPQIQLAIKRLEKRGLVVFLRREKPESSGNWRRVYALTIAGKELAGRRTALPAKDDDLVGCSPGILTN
jgi:DNA-binding MarR family transcriptional regulator